VGKKGLGEDGRILWRVTKMRPFTHSSAAARPGRVPAGL